MTKKLESMWQCSRFILPEHREKILESQRAQLVLSRPQLDEQELQVMDAVFRESQASQRQIRLSIYDITRYKDVTGIVARVDRYLKRVQIVLHDPFAAEPESVWIPLTDIQSAELVESLEWTEPEKEMYLEAEQNSSWDELGWDRDEGP